MSILYDDDQNTIARESIRILQARTDKGRLLALLETVGTYDESFWKTAVEQGWTALVIAEEFGGLGLGLVELGLVAQAAGAVTSGAPFLNAGFGVALGLDRSDIPDLKNYWLRRLASGEVTATIAFGEGSNPLPRKPSVTFVNGSLTGTKKSVVGGLSCELALVWAKTADGPALVLAELVGVERVPVNSFDNSRLYADILFDSTPATLLAVGDSARTLADEILAQMAVVAAHEQVGGAEALLHTARDYALTRKAFGQFIGAFQSVKHRIAEMYGLVEIARANCIHAAARSGHADFLIAAADARISAIEAYDTCARDCVQIHGGIGVTWEQGLHLHMRRSRSLAIELGNTLYWEDLLVEQLTGVAA